MKKIICLFLVLAIIIVFSSIAFSDFDLSTLSFDELIALRQMVDEYLYRYLDKEANHDKILVYGTQDGSYSFFILQPDLISIEDNYEIPSIESNTDDLGTELSKGTYITDEDIPAGTYILQTTDSFGYYTITNSQGEEIAKEYVPTYSKARIKLSNGDCLSTTFPGYISKASPIIID